MHHPKVIIVTGGTSGIGLALVQALAHQPRTLVVTCGRRKVPIAAIDSHPNVRRFELDVALASDREALVNAARRLGPVVGLVNNAAMQKRYLATDLNRRHDLDDEVALNVTAPVDLVHLLANDLNASKGFVANVSSGLAYIPLGLPAVYGATKAALSHYTKGLREQGHAFRAVEVVLPMVATKMTEGRGRGKMTAEAAAAQIAKGIARGESTIWVGKAKALPLLLKFVPGLLRRLLGRGESLKAS